MDMRAFVGIVIFLMLLVLGMVSLPVMVGTIEPAEGMTESDIAQAEVVNDFAVAIYSILPALGITVAALAIGGVTFMLLRH